MQKIEELSLRKGWSYQDLAKEAKLAPSTITNINKGHSVYPNTLKKLAKALGVDHPQELVLPEREISPHASLLQKFEKLLRVTPEQELRRWLDAAVSSEVRNGYAARETAELFNLVLHLSQRAQLDQLPDFYRIPQGLCNACIVQGDFHTAQQLVRVWCSTAKRLGDTVSLVAARVSVASILAFSGKFACAREYLERLLERPEVSLHRSTDIFTDARVACLGYLAHVLYALGYPDQARQQMNDALKRAQDLQHRYTLAFIRHFGAALHQVRCEYDDAKAWAQEEKVCGAQLPSALWHIGGMIQHGWAIAMLGQCEEGIEELRRGMDQWCAPRAMSLVLPRWLTLLAEAYGRIDQPGVGVPQLEQALMIIEQTGERNYEAEVHRQKGKLLLRQSSAETAEAERCFHTALAVARRQQAKSFELRAAVSLGQLWQQQGKYIEARKLLAPIYGWFTEGFDTADLREARALLENLAGQRH
jgi:tetratricopeptide (TPR) repeat protein